MEAEDPMEVERAAREQGEESETDSSEATNSSDEDSSDDDSDHEDGLKGASLSESPFATEDGVASATAEQGEPAPAASAESMYTTSGHAVIAVTMLGGRGGTAGASHLAGPVAIKLKSVITNARSTALADVFRAGEEMAKRTDVDRMEALRTELMSRPGSTWADYSARRLITRQCQESKPEAERFEFLPEGDAKRWGAAILKQIPYEMKVREKLEQMLRAQKRLRSGDSGDDGDRGKRRRGERVYKCRREKSGCIAVFASKEERDEHYKKVHNFVRTPGDANHQLRCPIADCVHRYPSKPKLEKHIREAHYLFAEMLDVDLLVLIMASKTKKTPRLWKSPFRDDPTVHEDLAALDDHLEKAHPEIRIKLLRSKERRKILLRRDARQRIQAQLQREAAAAQGYPWDDKQLDALKPGTLVWARYREYPFWPGLVDSNTVADKARKLKVYFLGDETCEVIVNYEKNLRPYRGKYTDQFIKVGHAHSLKEYFAQAMVQAEREERRMLLEKQGRGAGDLAILDRAGLRKLGRRAGVSKPVSKKEFAWTDRTVRQLKVGTLVWARLRSYPYWPSRVERVVKSSTPNKPPAITVQFFGDHAWERIYNIDENLRLFRDGKFEIYARAGIGHPHGGAAHREAVAEAVAYEAAHAVVDDDGALVSATAARGAGAAAAATPVPRWYPQPGKGGKAARGAKAAPKKPDAADRELGNLVFGAPGKKVQGAVDGMSERERRKLQRALQMSEASAASAAVPALAMADPKKGRKHFKIEARFPIREVLFDFLAPPPPEAASGGSARSRPPKGSKGQPKAAARRPERARKPCRPRKNRKPGPALFVWRTEQVAME